MGGEMGRIRPTRVFERAGESRMTPPALSEPVNDIETPAVRIY